MRSAAWTYASADSQSSTAPPRLSVNLSKVFDLELPLEQVAEGYRAMDERRAIKTLLRA